MENFNILDKLKNPRNKENFIISITNYAFDVYLNETMKKLKTTKNKEIAIDDMIIDYIENYMSNMEKLKLKNNMMKYCYQNHFRKNHKAYMSNDKTLVRNSLIKNYKEFYNLKKVDEQYINNAELVKFTYEYALREKMRKLHCDKNTAIYAVTIDCIKKSYFYDFNDFLENIKSYCYEKFINHVSSLINSNDESKIFNFIYQNVFRR